MLGQRGERKENIIDNEEGEGEKLKEEEGGGGREREKERARREREKIGLIYKKCWSCPCMLVDYLSIFHPQQYS